MYDDVRMLCIYVCKYVCHAYIQINRQPGRQSERPTDRTTGRHRCILKYIQTYVHACVRTYIHTYMQACTYAFTNTETHTHCLLAICIHGQHILKAFIHVLVSCVYLADARIYVLADGLDGWVGRRGRRRPYMEACTLM